MRHRVKGRKLGRNASHRKAMFRNMAASLIRSLRIDEDDEAQPKVPGRIVTTLPKAKELKPMVEKLITMARKASVIESNAAQYASDAEANSDAWQQWRESEKWNQWNQAIAPAIALRRKAASILRDPLAVDVLFEELAERFADRNGGYLRVAKLAQVRLGDAGTQAILEFVGERDRTRSRRVAPVVASEPATEAVEDVAESAVGSDVPDENVTDAPEASEPADDKEKES